MQIKRPMNGQEGELETVQEAKEEEVVRKKRCLGRSASEDRV